MHFFKLHIFKNACFFSRVDDREASSLLLIIPLNEKREMEENRLKINGFFSISAFFVATQFFFTLSFMNILLAIILVVVYLLFIQDAYRSHLLRYIGIDLLIAGSINSLTILIRFKNTFHKSFDLKRFEKVELNLHTTCFCKISYLNFAFVTKHMRAKLLQQRHLSLEVIQMTRNTFFLLALF